VKGGIIFSSILIMVGIILIVFFMLLNSDRNSYPPAITDGFLGISGVLKNKTYLSDLGVSVHRYGFALGVGGNLKLHLKNMKDILNNGSIPIALLWVSKVENEKKIFEEVKELVEYFTSGDGARQLGYRIIYWELGNEINWGWGTSCDAEEYYNRIRVYVPAIREACPDAVIIMGSLLNIYDPPDRKIENYLETFLNKGGGELVDVYNFHYYGLADPTLGTENYLTGVEIFKRIKGVLKRHGYGDKPIWITETSTFSGKVGEIYQSEEMQAADLVKRFITLKAIGVEKVLWCFVTEPRYEGTGEGFFDQSGLVYDGYGPYDRGKGIKKRGYYAYKYLSQWIDSSNFVESWNDSVIYIFKFEGGGKEIYILWQDKWDQNVVIHIEGRNLRLYTIYGESIVLSDNAKVDYTLGIEPLYIMGDVEKVTSTSSGTISLKDK